MKKDEIRYLFKDPERQMHMCVICGKGTLEFWCIRRRCFSLCGEEHANVLAQLNKPHFAVPK